MVVTGYAVRAAGTTNSYRDAFFATTLGTLAVSSPAVTLASGATTTINGSLTALTTVQSGRSLIGQMNLTSAQGSILGTGTVLVTSVMPSNGE